MSEQLEIESDKNVNLGFNAALCPRECAVVCRHAASCKTDVNKTALSAAILLLLCCRHGCCWCVQEGQKTADSSSERQVLCVCLPCVM